MHLRRCLRPAYATLRQQCFWNAAYANAYALLTPPYASSGFGKNAYALLTPNLPGLPLGERKRVTEKNCGFVLETLSLSVSPPPRTPPPVAFGPLLRTSAS